MQPIQFFVNINIYSLITINKVKSDEDNVLHYTFQTKFYVNRYL
jgi:hypothetical protein